MEHLLGDHLESTSITTGANGAKTSKLRYNPWGEVRLWWTARLSPPRLRTDSVAVHRQRKQAESGLYFYQSGYYDPSPGRFAQADIIIIPGGSATAVNVNLATSIAQNTFTSQLFHTNVSSILIGNGNLSGDIALEQNAR
ncbi:MAG: hypothetical protein ACOYYF_11130 [Chloroflexota bacterium]|nr:hypothetical protein [Chloroflexota bacterium]MBI5702487.1 hypothetical protein [Chloroflexota bacterium]